jgi:hypothetical protein
MVMFVYTVLEKLFIRTDPTLPLTNPTPKEERGSMKKRLSICWLIKVKS